MSESIVIHKSGHTFILAWDDGGVDDIYGELCLMARNPNLPLDWIDAGVIADQIGSRTRVAIIAEIK